MSRILATTALLLLVGCGARAMQLTMPEPTSVVPEPTETPSVRPVSPQLVAYPGLEVALVSNADGEVYHLRSVFYTYLDSRWFYAQSLQGPWRVIEMKYVPADLFRVRGHRPPGVERMLDSRR